MRKSYRLLSAFVPLIGHALNDNMAYFMSALTTIIPHFLFLFSLFYSSFHFININIYCYVKINFILSNLLLFDLSIINFSFFI
jgi:hypothetical protein